MFRHNEVLYERTKHEKLLRQPEPPAEEKLNEVSLAKRNDFVNSPDRGKKSYRERSFCAIKSNKTFMQQFRLLSIRTVESSGPKVRSLAWKIIR